EDGFHLPGQASELLEVALRQALQHPQAAGGEREPDNPPVDPVASPPYQPCGLGSIHEPHGAVVAEQEVAGDVGDGRPVGIRVSPDGEEQLVLGRGEAGGDRLLLAPPEEPPQPGSQTEEALVVLVGHGSARRHNVYRITIYNPSGGPRRPTRGHVGRVMETSTRRIAMLCLLAAVLGLAGGGAAWVLLRLIALLTNLALLHLFGWTLPSFAHFHPGPLIVPVAAAGGLIVALLAKWSPVIKGHGIPEAMEAVLARQSRISPRAAVAKPLSAAIAIGTGGPFGAEGPIIVTGGAIG